jgi:hypothetical protein
LRKKGLNPKAEVGDQSKKANGTGKEKKKSKKA